MPALYWRCVGHPFTRSLARRSGCASCSDDSGYCTDGNRDARIIPATRSTNRSMRTARNGPIAVTERGDQDPPRRRRKLIDLSDRQLERVKPNRSKPNRTSRIGLSLPNFSRSSDQGGACGVAGPASARLCLDGPSAHAGPALADSVISPIIDQRTTDSAADALRQTPGCWQCHARQAKTSRVTGGEPNPLPDYVALEADHGTYPLHLHSHQGR